MDFLSTYVSVKGAELAELLTELVFVLAVATAFVALSRRRPRTRLRAVVRRLLDRRVWASRSAWLDYKYTVLNIMIFPVLLGVAVLGSRQVAGFFASLVPPSSHEVGLLTETQARIVVTALVFLALEFAYWLDHYLSHKLPLLWEFHKVHHTAEVLTPLTVYRVHPLDTIVYYNMKSVVAGFAYFAAIFALDCEPITTMESTVIVVYMWLYGHLQHSQLWITFGWFGKFVFSPAHHQIHHSKARIHHNTNFGMSLTLFDWLFGTLHRPAREKQALEFGVAHDTHAHGFRLSLADPMVRAFRRLLPARRRPDTVRT